MLIFRVYERSAWGTTILDIGNTFVAVTNHRSYNERMPRPETVGSWGALTLSVCAHLVSSGGFLHLIFNVGTILIIVASFGYNYAMRSAGAVLLGWVDPKKIEYPLHPIPLGK